MEYKHVREIDFASKINERVFGIFLAQDVDVRIQTDGKTKYITVNMIDKEFKMNAKKFGATEAEISKMYNGGVYLAAIDIKPYKKDPSGYSCILYNFDTFDENPSNFIQWADGMEEACRILNEALGIISTSVYGAIVSNIITANWDKFRVWAAATGLHHNLPGGLLVHTAEVVKQAEGIAEVWKKIYGDSFINTDVLLSAAILHDIGKIRELNVDSQSYMIEYSTQSALETHISMCISMIEIEAYKLNIGYTANGKTDEQVAKEQEAISVLKHCILAHHGKLEYGSPIVPNTPEAYILNTADLLSSEMFRYNKNFRSMESGKSHSAWIGGNISVTYKDATK